MIHAVDCNFYFFCVFLLAILPNCRPCPLSHDCLRETRSYLVWLGVATQLTFGFSRTYLGREGVQISVSTAALECYERSRSVQLFGCAYVILACYILDRKYNVVLFCDKRRFTFFFADTFAVYSWTWLQWLFLTILEAMDCFLRNGWKISVSFSSKNTIKCRISPSSIRASFSLTKKNISGETYKW